jgi:hypothetical protein
MLVQSYGLVECREYTNDLVGEYIKLKTQVLFILHQPFLLNGLKSGKITR